VTDWLRASWLSERGAPSKLGVALAGKSGMDKRFCIEKLLSNLVLCVKSIKIMPENQKNNQHFSVNFELHFSKVMLQWSVPRNLIGGS
jgi:hypothetical protein